MPRDETWDEQRRFGERTMRRFLHASLLWLVACLALTLGPRASFAAEQRFALVVGNSQYKTGTLATPANDAGLVADALQAAGFTVTGARDLDQATLTARLDAQDYLLRALSVTQSEHGAQLRKLTDHQVRLADNQAAMADEQTRLADHQAAMADEQTRQATNQAAIADEQTRMAGEQQRTTSALGRVEAGVRTIIGLLDRDG